MFSSMLGLFSQDLAVDLGTCNTRVHPRSGDHGCTEPTVVAVRTDNAGQRHVTALGAEAQPMLGRTPQDIMMIRPIRAGKVVDFEVTEAFLLHLVRRIHGRNGWMRPRMVVAIPHNASEMELRAVRDSCESAGAREVHLVPRPIASALGAELPLDQPAGQLVVDIGGGATEISLLVRSGVAHATVVAGGGEGMDAAIVAWMSAEHALLVGSPSAEALKLKLGTAAAPDAARTAIVKGRCLQRGVPRSQRLTEVDIHCALQASIDAIAQGIRTCLEDAPPELAADVVDRGVVLTGGTSQLRGLDSALRDRTGLPIVTAEDPGNAVIHGVRRLLGDRDLLASVACGLTASAAA